VIRNPRHQITPYLGTCHHPDGNLVILQNDAKIGLRQPSDLKFITGPSMFLTITAKHDIRNDGLHP